MKSSQPARIGKAGVFIAAALLFSCQTQNNSNAPSDPSSSAESASEADKPQVFEMRVPAYEQIPAVRIKLGLRGLSKTTFDEVRTPLTNYVYVPVRQCIGEFDPESARGRSYVARMEVQNGKPARFLEHPSAAEKAGELLDKPVRQCVREALESRKAELATDETLQLDVHVFIHES
jgi:hypothetical protein